MRRICSAVALCLLLLAVHRGATASSVNGIVTDKSRKPVAGAVVQVIESRQHYFLPRDLMPLAECRSDASGHFSIDAPVSGTISLLAWAPGLRMTKFTMEPGEGASRTVGLALEPADVISGKVVDPDDRPVAGAMIGPLLSAPDIEYSVARRTIPQWTATGADGSFRFENVMKEIELRFLTRKEGFEIADTAVRLNRTGITVRLRRGGSDLPGQLFCKSPSVRLEGLRLRLNGNGFDVITTSGANGEFSYSGLPVGTFSLEVIDAPDRPSRVLVLNMPADSGKKAELEVSGGYYIEGMAVDAETSMPASGVALAVNDQTVYTDGGGHYRAGPFWLRGMTRIEVLAESGFRATPESMEIVAGLPPASGFDDIRDLDIRVRRLREVRVQIANFELTTVPVQVHMAAPRASGLRAETRTASATLRAATGGQYYLHAVSGGLTSELTTVSVGETPQVRAALQLQEAAAVPGRIEMAATTATTGMRSFAARVFAGQDPTSTVLLAEAGCTADGCFFFHSLPNGILKFEISNASGTRRQSEWVPVKPGRNEPVIFRLPPGNTLAGAVRSIEGKLLPGVNVRLYFKDSTGLAQAITVESGPEGAFSATDLDTRLIESVQVDYRGYAAFREQNVKLPATDYQVALMPEGNLRAVVNAPPSTRWTVRLMQSNPWNRGAYPEQLMSRELERRAAEGGTTVTFEASTNGRYHVVAQGDGGALAVSDPVLFVSESVEGETVVLEPGLNSQLSGSVKGGSADPGMEIIATNTTLPDGQTQDFKTTLADGRFQYANLPPGDYLVLGMGTQMTAVATNVELRPGGSSRVELEVMVLPTLRGKVTLQNQPQAGVEVKIVSQTEPDAQPKTATTGSDGSFVFEYLSADNYWLTARITPPGGSELKAQRQITLERGVNPPELNLDISPPRSVSFRFPGNLGVRPGAEVTFMNKETRETTRVTWDSENATGPLAAGEYEVWREDQVLGPASVDAEGRVTFGP